VEIRQLLSEVLDYLRQLLLIKVGGGGVSLDLPSEMLATMTLHAADFTREELLRAVRLFNQAALELKGGTQSQLPLELAFIEAAAPSAQPAAVSRGRNSTTAAPKTPESSPPPSQATPAQLSSPSPAQASASDMVTEPSAAMAELQRRWKEVLSTVRQHSFKTEAALRSSCQPLTVERGVLTIAFRHEFHKGMIEDPEHRPAVEQAISAVLGQPHKVRCVLMSDQRAMRARQPAQNRPVPVETGRTEKDSTPTVEASLEDKEDKQPVQEIRDPVVREAIASYGATIVSVTRR
jgi:DNA polymerase III gamma/tau subunit